MTRLPGCAMGKSMTNTDGTASQALILETLRISSFLVFILSSALYIRSTRTICKSMQSKDHENIFLHPLDCLKLNLRSKKVASAFEVFEGQ